MGHATRSRVEAIPQINTRAELVEFYHKYGLRPDWHEPDDQGIDAIIYGSRLDNAFGAGWIPDVLGVDGEYNVILTHDGQRVAVLNLANLLAWATEGGL
jgi:hypothetical protein